VDFQNNSTAEELVSEINRLDKAIPFISSAESITVCGAKYEPGQKMKMEAYSLDCAEFVRAFHAALASRMDELLEALRASHPEDFLALKKQAGSKIDSTTAEISWVYANRFDPYGIDPGVADECFEDLCYASSPMSRISVWIGDLPNETKQALRLRLPKDPGPLWWRRKVVKRLASQLESSES